jgi:hypothetical protein
MVSQANFKLHKNWKATLKGQWGPFPGRYFKYKQHRIFQERSFKYKLHSLSGEIFTKVRVLTQLSNGVLDPLEPAPSLLNRRPRELYVKPFFISLVFWWTYLFTGLKNAWADNSILTVIIMRYSYCQLWEVSHRCDSCRAHILSSPCTSTWDCVHILRLSKSLCASHYR